MAAAWARSPATAPRPRPPSPARARPSPRGPRPGGRGPWARPWGTRPPRRPAAPPCRTHSAAPAAAAAPSIRRCCRHLAAPGPGRPRRRTRQRRHHCGAGLCASNWPQLPRIATPGMAAEAPGNGHQWRRPAQMPQPRRRCAPARCGICPLPRRCSGGQAVQAVAHGSAHRRRHARRPPPPRRSSPARCAACRQRLRHTSPPRATTAAPNTGRPHPRRRPSLRRRSEEARCGTSRRPPACSAGSSRAGAGLCTAPRSRAQRRPRPRRCG
mmetsp:Transcript_99071/g.296002  ORF Transcript_99071/g.296002 Transcript_99071/m.296002 type:complete len:269 (-) Transcript_99071:369-1175(-)